MSFDVILRSKKAMFMVRKYTGWTDRWTYGRSDGRMDTTSYKDYKRYVDAT